MEKVQRNSINKNKIDLNNRKRTDHSPSPGKQNRKNWVCTGTVLL